MKRFVLIMVCLLGLKSLALAKHQIIFIDASNFTSGTLPNARLDPSSVTLQGQNVLILDGSTQTKSGVLAIGQLTVGSTATVGAYFDVGGGSRAQPSGPATITVGRNRGSNVSVIQFDNGVTNGVATIQGRAGGNALDVTVGGPAAALTVMTIKSTNVLITGDLTVTGYLAASTKAFKIPHPTKQDQWLYHAAIESDKYGLVYDGEAHLSGGKVTIQLPDYIELVLAPDSRTLQLTSKDGYSPLYLDGEIKNGEFTVATKNGDPNQKFFWQLSGKRGDPSIKNGLADEDGNLKVEQDINPSEVSLEDHPEVDQEQLTEEDKVSASILLQRGKYAGFEKEMSDIPVKSIEAISQPTPESK